MDLKTIRRLANLRSKPNREYIKSLAWIIGQFWPDNEQVPERDKQDETTLVAHVRLLPPVWSGELNKELDRLCTKKAKFFGEDVVVSGEAKKTIDGVKRRFGLI